MATLTTRPYVGEDDLRAIADLVNASESAGQLDEDTSVSDLRLLLDMPTVDKSRDLRLWKNSKGRLIGFGQLSLLQSSQEIEGTLWFYAHPILRNQGLETEIIQWGETRMAEIRRSRTTPVKLRTSSRSDFSDRQILLEKAGFLANRCFITMASPLHDLLPKPQLPEGFTLYHLSDESDIKDWVEMFNESFIDHWNHHDLTTATVREWMRNPNYRPDLNIVAVSPEGRFAAFCYGYINSDDNARTGQKEGWIKWLGTSRRFRKMGLGHAVLLSGMRQLKAAGMDTVKLGVDADSLTGATRLYRAVGFQPVDSWMSYVKEI